MNEEQKLIKPAIFIDNEDSKKEEKLIVPATFDNDEKKGPLTKQYLILAVFTASDENRDIDKSFEFVTGRPAAWEMIKSMIEYLDIHESLVLVEGVKLENAKTVYEFMKYAEVFFPDDSFDIEDYNYGDVDEQDLEEINKSEFNFQAPINNLMFNDQDHGESQDL